MSRDTKLKAGVIAAAVVLLGALLVWRAGGSDGAPGLANSVLTIDIQDGKVYRVPVGGKRSVVFPAANPAGDYTLLPIVQLDGGEGYRINPTYTDADLAKQYNPEIIDPATGRVLVPVEQPASLR